MELHIAMGFGTEEDIQRLLDEGCDVNVPDARGWYPLHRAVEKKNYKLVQLFLKSGARTENKLAPNHCMGYNSQCSALFIAVQNSNLDMVKLLLDFGADVNCLDSNGWRPHHTLLVPSTFYETFGQNVASIKKDLSNVDVEVLSILAARGADLNAATTGTFRGFASGTTAAHMAARCGNSVALEHLIQAKAVVDTADANGKTPISFADESGDTKCVNLLLSAGCSRSVAQTEGVQNAATT